MVVVGGGGVGVGGDTRLVDPYEQAMAHHPPQITRRMMSHTKRNTTS